MKKILQIKYVILLSLLFMMPVSFSEIQVASLFCEYQINPLGIDVKGPGLSWKLESEQRNQTQKAYQILVSDELELLQKDTGNLWDSGKVNSSNTLQIVYGGKPLKSRQICYWKVRVWDKDGKPSEWSSSSRWEMGLMNSDDWDAIWIESPQSNAEKEGNFYGENPAPIFRKEFKTNRAIQSARLYISGLGYYEAWLNGQRIGDRQLDPPWTDYSKRVFYSVYDITDMLKSESDHCIGVMLGNGWYNPLPLQMWGHLNLCNHLPIGRPRLIAQVEIDYQDGRREVIGSDHNWKTTDGPIRRNNIYLGEIYDARKEICGWKEPGFDDKKWQSSIVSDTNVGHLVAISIPGIRITKKIAPVKMKTVKPGVVIYDFGQNFSGWVRLRLDTESDQRIRLRYGELLYDDGTLNPMTSVCGQIKKPSKRGEGAPDVAWQEDIYITKGNGVEYYQPRFTFRGFRYVELSGCSDAPDIDAITGLRLNTDVREVGSFTCSNTLFNQIQQNTCWTFLSNLFSVQSDCPHRERFGYGGDIVVSCNAFMMNYDMAGFYANTVRLFEDAAKPDGRFPDTAPFIGLSYCGVGWEMAHPLLTHKLYRYYGNRRIVDEQFPVAKKWLSALQKEYPDGIIDKGLSDHEGLEEKPEAVMITQFYCQSIRLLEKLAEINGHSEDSHYYHDLHEAVRQKYLERFFEPKSGKVGPCTQGSQAFAIYSGLFSDEQLRKPLGQLLEQIEQRQNHLSTGIFGTRFMLNVLSEHGYADKAYQIVNQRTFPGWGYMIEKGATTLWEHWDFSDDIFSHNHPMFGSVSEWFYQWLAGIQPAPEAVGFDRIWIRPQMVPELDWVRCRYDSVRGPIESNWQREAESLQLDVTIPPNTSAMIFLPQTDIRQITENSRCVDSIQEIELVRRLPEVVLKVGSGKYHFLISKVSD